MTFLGAGLSMYHISPQKVWVEDVFPVKPRITFRRGASLAKVDLGKIQGLQGRRVDWRRGTINSFSKQSRRRMLRLVASLKRSERPVFMTLTYPDIFPEDPKIWKKHLDSFFKRFLRRFPHAVLIWRLERKERQTGLNSGKIAPHFHILAYNAPYIVILEWLSRAWYQVVGSGDLRHFNAGTRVEPVRSVNGILYYTSKYICKAENDVLEGIGRAWGVVNREELEGIQGEFQVVELDPKTAMIILRYMRRRGSELYKKGRYIGRRKVPKWGTAYTLICDSEFWFNALPKIQSLSS